MKRNISSLFLTILITILSFGFIKKNHAVAIDISKAKITYPIYDGNGNITKYVDSDGEPVYEAKYDPFGNIIEEKIKPGEEKPAPFLKKGFSTKVHDRMSDSSDLIYYGYRHYSPNLGRFISKDPIEEAGGINLYAMAENNAVNQFDILGLTIDMCRPCYDTHANIWSNYGVHAFTGDPDAVAVARPKAIGIDTYEKKKDANKCCAKVKKASKLKIKVRSYLPSDWGNPTDINGRMTAYSRSGYNSTVQHEARRRDVYTRANQAYLVPAETTGTQAIKCGWVCRDSHDAAEMELDVYLDNLRTEAKDLYDNYVNAEQSAIGAEGTANDKHEPISKLF